MKDLTKEEIKEMISKYGIKRRVELISFMMGYKSRLTSNEWDTIIELKREEYIND